MSTQPKLINVKLGDITSKYSNYYDDNNDLNIYDFTKQINKDENTVDGIFLLYFILSLTTWLVFLLLFNSRFIKKYDWYGLYYSLIKKGYQPKEINSWVVVKKRGCINGSLIYNCQDGNHRHMTLLLIHGPEKKVEVRLV